MARIQKGENDLESWCLNNGEFGQKLMTEWTGICDDGTHYRIDEISFGSNKKFKWICSKGHEWFANVNSRTARKRGCPYCSSNLVSNENSLKNWCLSNGSFGKQLMSEWTGECEDGKHYKIGEVARASGKKFKWRCCKNHEWYAHVNSRTKYTTECPYCLGKRASTENSLKTWCSANGSFGERLISEWTGECEDNQHYEIDEVTRASNKKFKWKCSKGHEWFAKVNSRTSQKQRCPYCSGYCVSEKNSLKTWCSSNGSFGKQLMTEWTGICADGNHYSIDQISFGSNKKFKWGCLDDHEWFADVNYRTAKKSGCPYCSGNRVSDKNCLKTWCLNNGSFGKQLISEWTGICEDGTHSNIDQVSFGSGKKFNWRCSKGHEWISTIKNRTSNNSGCPYCFKNGQSEIASKARLSNENSLKTWCLSNGEFGKQLMTEWTGKCDDGSHYEIDKVARGSRKKFKWICSKGHNWSTTVVGRTSRKTGCPYCNAYGTSYPEQFIYHSLKQIFPNTENRCRVLRSPQNPQGVEFDIGIPDIPLCIEYSPTYWHEGKEEHDQYKKDLCQKAKVRLVQIIEDSYDELPFKMKADYICFKMNYNQQDEILEIIVDHILKSLGHSIAEVDLEDIKKNAWNAARGYSDFGS